MKQLVLVVILALVGGCQKSAPDFVDVSGVAHHYSDYAGKYVLVNYWATWCGPCIKEIPELNKLAAEHKGKLVVLGVNYDGPVGKDAKQQAEQMGIEFPVYASDPSQKLAIQIPEVLPTTFIFSPGLKLQQTLVGPQTEATVMQALGKPDQAAPSS